MLNPTGVLILCIQISISEFPLTLRKLKKFTCSSNWASNNSKRSQHSLEALDIIKSVCHTVPWPGALPHQGSFRITITQPREMALNTPSEKKACFYYIQQELVICVCKRGGKGLKIDSILLISIVYILLSGLIWFQIIVCLA